MAQETNNPPNTPKMSDEARDLVLRLKDLVTATSERIAASRKMVVRLDSIDDSTDHDDAPGKQ
jgi:hypothetical protein